MRSWHSQIVHSKPRAKWHHFVWNVMLAGRACPGSDSSVTEFDFKNSKIYERILSSVTGFDHLGHPFSTRNQTFNCFKHKKVLSGRRTANDVSRGAEKVKPLEDMTFHLVRSSKGWGASSFYGRKLGTGTFELTGNVNQKCISDLCQL